MEIHFVGGVWIHDFISGIQQLEVVKVRVGALKREEYTFFFRRLAR